VGAVVARRHRRACGVLRPIPNYRLEIRSNPERGRGIFARAPIPAGALIETAPVMLAPPEQCALFDQTILRDYYFAWGDSGVGAVALGLVSLCNHAARPNARVRRNPAQETLDLLAVAPISAGEEITIDYNCPLWFTPRD
jgi:SET domain-containing protein